MPTAASARASVSGSDSGSTVSRRLPPLLHDRSSNKAWQPVRQASTWYPDKFRKPVSAQPYRTWSPPVLTLPGALLAPSMPGLPGAEERRVMQARIRNALADPVVRAAFVRDLASTLDHVGMHEDAGASTQEAAAMAAKIVEMINRDLPLPEIERRIHAMLRAAIVDHFTDCSFLEALAGRMRGRTDRLYSLLHADLRALRGRKILDYGASDGALARMIGQRISPHVTALGVASCFAPCPDPGVATVSGASRLATAADAADAAGAGQRVRVFDGKAIPHGEASFDAVIAINVFHHVRQNQQCIDDIRRVLRPGGKLLALETALVGDTPERLAQDRERTFLNDYFHNRLLNPQADVPVPGAYETTEGWERRFQDSGFRSDRVEQLGVDDPLVPNRHVLYALSLQHRPCANDVDLLARLSMLPP
jgi:SAM-dependent methyltransferase